MRFIRKLTKTGTGGMKTNIPKEVKKELNIKIGDCIEFILVDGKVELIKNEKI